MKEESENDIPDEYQNNGENNVNNLMWGNREGGGKKEGDSRKKNKHMLKYIRKLNKTCKLRK